MRLPPLIEGRLIRRYKRFLADVALSDGRIVTAHCANPGAMLGLQATGSRVWLSQSSDPARKLKFSWHLVEADFGEGRTQIVGIDTSLPNRLAEEAILAGRVGELAGYTTLRREVGYGINSRIDLLLTGTGRPDTYVEIKNVHFMRQPGLAEFPDSVTSRGAKHLEEMGAMVEAGHRAVMLYVIQMQASRFSLAADLDPAYARAFARARQRGVEALAYTCNVTPQDITLDQRIPMIEGQVSAVHM
jgi:sugar fermentation stimulation protein A